MRTRSELLEEVEYLESSARMWDSIAANVPTAALQATLRATEHRELAKATARRARTYNIVYWITIVGCLLGLLICVAAS